MRLADEGLQGPLVKFHQSLLEDYFFAKRFLPPPRSRYHHMPSRANSAFGVGWEITVPIARRTFYPFCDHTNDFSVDYPGAFSVLTVADRTEVMHPEVGSIPASLALDRPAGRPSEVVTSTGRRPEFRLSERFLIREPVGVVVTCMHTSSITKSPLLLADSSATEAPCISRFFSPSDDSELCADQMLEHCPDVRCSTRLTLTL